jgi:hypothetical protein
MLVFVPGRSAGTRKLLRNEVATIGIENGAETSGARQSQPVPA